MKPALTLRRSYTGSPRAEDDDKFWKVIYQGLYVGSINQQQGPGGDEPHWAWSISMHAGEHANGVRQATPTDGRAATRDACLPAFRKAFERYLIFIGEEGWASHVEHMRRIGSNAETKRY